MRSSALPALVILGLVASGCSRVGIEDIVPRPSQETTSSIERPVTPSVRVGASAPAQTSAPAEKVEDQIAALSGGETDSGFAMPALETAALVPTPRPATRSQKAIDAVIHPQRFRDAKPINFGKVAPRHYAVHGVDVSRWQGEIDWPKLRSQGANFAFIKATDGGDHLDPMFMKNWTGAAAAGIRRGAYHFFYWCRPASEQADWFIRNVPKVAGALPPVIDVEWNGESRCRKRPSPAQVREKMQVFMDRLERHYGQRPIIYTAPDFYADNLKGAFTDYPFWLRAVAQHPSRVYPGRKWVFWQYSGSGLSHGVKGNIDLNVFNGTEAQWRNWLGGRQLMAEAD
ncbi:glycoside hydrolase family 25 protein [Aquamicrobium defluvii]|uniref:Glycosyl hydrolase n=1 Tax=Aquamicrobium defluvii TaxID=69279 RepID=A0A011TBP6_9HYPH|nr:GH25 family lysozyme [Aquamicrobium defluvii]EXL09039.1 glycosyl hydrolase [Aquamicrobium defluvii]EZQ15339.1 glycosyl hydrolase [Halopseudomonas bauzanensis]TDR34597.1 lysozyme [Aquamicrobium defluvii]